jgi:hypothetical protein
VRRVARRKGGKPGPKKGWRKKLTGEASGVRPADTAMDRPSIGQTVAKSWGSVMNTLRDRGTSYPDGTNGLRDVVNYLADKLETAQNYARRQFELYTEARERLSNAEYVANTRAGFVNDVADGKLRGRAIRAAAQRVKNLL